MVDSEPPPWDQSRREVGLVALQAAVLTRRIFLPAVGRHELAPEQWQILLALALIDSAPYEHATASVESLANQLTLDREYAHELVFALMSDGLVLGEEEQDEDPPRLRLSARGWEAVGAYLERARRFLPGWPPKRRLDAPDA